MWKAFITSCLVLSIASTDIAPRKCCPEGSVLLRRKDSCFDPKLNKTSSINKTLDCPIKVRLQHYTINSLGEIVLMVINGNNITIANDKYCVANKTTIKDVELKNVTNVAVVCSEEEEKIIDDRVAGYCMIVSIVFLLLTALVYAALPRLRDLQGKSFISFCCTLSLGLIVIITLKFMEYVDMTMCAVRGFLAYYFILSTFFWTNAISIQLLLCIRRPSIMSYEWKDFMWYGLYAWGCPALLTMIMALVNFLPGNHPRPGIGLMHCWFYDKNHQWYYMYSVMTILILSNILMFIYTSICLWRNTFATSHLKALKYKFIMTIKLFILMGITWIAEMISSLVENNIYWTVIDLFNLLQGFLIFLVLVVFRKRVIKAMYHQGWLNCMSNVVEKHLAVGEDDEQDVVEHTRDVALEDK